jgi:hypothetical protein
LEFEKKQIETMVRKHGNMMKHVSFTVVLSNFSSKSVKNCWNFRWFTRKNGEVRQKFSELTALEEIGQ